MDYGGLLSKYDFAELRLERSANDSISIKDGEVRQSAGSSTGMSVRVLVGGSWGFASCSGEGDPEELLKRAERLAALGKGRISVGPGRPLKGGRKDRIEPYDPEMRVKGLLEASARMKGGRITSRVVSCTDSGSATEYYNSQGSHVVQETGYSYLSCACVAKEGSIIQRGAQRAWSRSGFGKMRIDEAADCAREKALRLLGAAAPPRGRFTAVFDPEMTGVFSHEAIGHACEADAVADRESILAGRLGSAIGNELVTITDDPLADDFGRYHYDDEGVEARAVTLVEKGALAGFLNSRETAHALRQECNGHARAEDYGEVPVVRMSNTYFQRGKSKKDEVFDVRSGVYLKGMKGGSVDIFSGGFMFKAEEAYEITNGATGKLMRDVTITGNILQTMLDVECVGDDFGTSPGMCGKSGQSVPVSDGGPHIRVKNVALG